MSSMPESSMNASYVPDSAPGAVISSGASGNPPFPPTCVARESAPFQVSMPSDSGPNRAYRSPALRQRDVAVLRVGHDRDAVERDRELDVVDAGRRCTPSPLRPRSAARRLRCRSRPCRRARTRRRSRVRRRSPATSGFCPEKSSATRLEIGRTVDEPEIVIDPVSPHRRSLPTCRCCRCLRWSSSSPPQAAATSERTSIPARMLAHVRALRMLRPSSSVCVDRQGC